MFCVSCGNQVQADYAFCPECGKAIVGVQEAASDLLELDVSEELLDELHTDDLKDFFRSSRDDLSPLALRELFFIAMSIVCVEDSDLCAIWIDFDDNHDWVSCDVFDDKYSILDMEFQAEFVSLFADTRFNTYVGYEIVKGPNYEGELVVSGCPSILESIPEYLLNSGPKNKILRALNELDTLTPFEENLKAYCQAAFADWD